MLGSRSAEGRKRMRNDVKPGYRRRTAALSERLSHLVSGVPLEQFLDESLRCIIDLGWATGGEVAVVNDKRQELEVVASRDMGFDSRGIRLAAGEGAMGQVVQTAEAIRIPDYRSFAGRSPKYARGRIRAAAALPLMLADQIVGALGLTYSDGRRRFSEESIASLKDFAALAAVAIERGRLQMLSRLQSQQLLLLTAKEELESTYERMRASLEEAANVQWALMPHRLPRCKGLSLGWRFLPCEELGGDGLDIVLLDEDRLGVYLLDVRGHGTAASLLSVTVSRVLSRMKSQSLLFEGGQQPSRVLPPAEVARRLNELFPMDESTGQYFTFIYGIVDKSARVFRYAAAGHPGPVRVSRAPVSEAFRSTGLPIGMVDAAAYEEVTIEYQHGDRFYLFSDGIVEAMDPDGNEFGLSLLQKVLRDSSGETLAESLDSALAALWEWRRVGTAEDDVSIVGLEIDDSRG